MQYLVLKSRCIHSDSEPFANLALIYLDVEEFLQRELRKVMHCEQYVQNVFGNEGTVCPGRTCVASWMN